MKPPVIAFLAAAAAMGASSLAGAQSADQPGVLERLTADGGAFVIGYRPDAAPFAYEARDAAGAVEPKGYSVALCRRIGQEVQSRVSAAGGPAIEIAYEPVSAGNRFQKLREGAIDILCGPTTLTLARQEEFDFSFLTFLTQGVLLFKKEREVDNIFGNTVGVIGNSTSADVLERVLAAEGAASTELQAFGSHDEAFAALQSGALDSYFADRSIVVQYAASDDSLEIAAGVVPVEQYALPMRGGDRELRLIANSVLAKLYRSKEISAIFEEAFPNAAMAESLVYLYTSFSISDGRPPQ